MTDLSRTVALPSGTWFEALTVEEAEFMAGLIDGYTKAFDLTHASDIADLDRIIQMETLVHRWSTWASTLKDYNGAKVDQVDLQKRIKESSTEIRQLKKSLGIDKLSRDRSKGEGSVPHYWASILARARHFVIMRNKQFDKALELSQQVIALVTFHMNSTEKERRMFGATAEDIVEWLRDVYKPEFEAIDAEFRANQQRHWIEEDRRAQQS